MTQGVADALSEKVWSLEMFGHGSGLVKFSGDLAVGLDVAWLLLNLEWLGVAWDGLVGLGWFELAWLEVVRLGLVRVWRFAIDINYSPAGLLPNMQMLLMRSHQESNY